jgi:CRISPR-associated endonuclease/helicase Cas3
LIKDQYHYVQVFICIDAQAEEIWNDYQANVANQRDLRKRMDAYLGIKQEFSRYVISVPKKLLLQRLGAESVIPLYLIDQFYDNETGFKRVADNEILIF